MSDTISKAAAERLKAEFYKHRERFEYGYNEYGYNEWCAVIDSMTEPEPPHEWKVGDWFYDKADNAIFRVERIRADNATFQVGRIRLKGDIDSKYRTHYKENCIPVHFIQKEGDEIREGSIVRTSEGWVGSVVSYLKDPQKWLVYGHVCAAVMATITPPPD